MMRGIPVSFVYGLYTHIGARDPNMAVHASAESPGGTPLRTTGWFLSWGLSSGSTLYFLLPFREVRPLHDFPPSLIADS